MQDELHRITTDELHDCIEEDIGGEGEVFVHSATELDMCVYSTYRDERGFHIDVGPMEEDKPRKVDGKAKPAGLRPQHIFEE